MHAPAPVSSRGGAGSPTGSTQHTEQPRGTGLGLGQKFPVVARVLCHSGVSSLGAGVGQWAGGQGSPAQAVVASLPGPGTPLSTLLESQDEALSLGSKQGSFCLRASLLRAASPVPKDP